MRKFMVLTLILLIIILSGCSNSVGIIESSDRDILETSKSKPLLNSDIQPLANPDILSFSEFYVNEFFIENSLIGINFTIFKRTIIEEEVYVTIGFGLNDGYLIGAIHLDNYRVLFDGNYYNLLQGYQLGLYTAENLISYGIKGVHRSCSYDDTCN